MSGVTRNVIVDSSVRIFGFLGSGDSDANQYDQGRVRDKATWSWYRHQKIAKGLLRTRSGEIPTPNARLHVVHLYNQSHVPEVTFRWKAQGFEGERVIAAGKRLLLRLELNAALPLECSWTTRSQLLYDNMIHFGHYAK